jgi:hypothetical protein
MINTKGTERQEPHSLNNLNHFFLDLFVHTNRGR